MKNRKKGVSEDRRRWMRARLNRTKNTNADIVAVPAPRLYTRPPLPSPRAWHVPHDYHLTRAPSDTRQGTDGTILKPRPSSARGPMPSTEPSSGRLSARSTILNGGRSPHRPARALPARTPRPSSSRRRSTECLPSPVRQGSHAALQRPTLRACMSSSIPTVRRRTNGETGRCRNAPQICGKGETRG